MYTKSSLAPESADNSDVGQNPYFAYLNEINQYKVLTPEEEASLFQKIAAGDNAAKDLFVKSNLKLVVKQAKKYYIPGYNDLLDLIQEGNLGLLKAVENFDPSKGCKFSTYAVYRINKAIQLTPSRLGLPVEIPPHMHALTIKTKHTISNFKALNSRPPSVDEIAEELGVPPDKIRPLLPFLSSQASLNQKLGDNSNAKELLDVFDEYYKEEASDVENTVIANETKAEFRKIICATLNDKEAYILYSRWGLANTPIKGVSVLAAELGMSAQGVRQCEERAVSKLRKTLLNLNKNLSDFI